MTSQAPPSIPGLNPAPAANVDNLKELKKNHVDALVSADQFNDWSIRFESYVDDCLGPNQLTSTGPYNPVSQEKILRFLIQVVKDKDGFAILQSINKDTTQDLTNSTRGYKAWSALTDHYLQEGIDRLDYLDERFRRKQSPTEKASVYITNVINTANAMKENGSELNDSDIKRQLFRGLLPEYSGYTASIRANQENFTLKDLIKTLKRHCGICESAKNSVVQNDPAANPASFFGTPADALGYQYPPRNTVNPGPAHAEVAEHLRLYIQNNNLSSAVENAVHHALAAVQLAEDEEGPTCYACGKKGHIATYCPKRQRLYNGPGTYGRYPGGRGLRGRGFRPGGRFGGRFSRPVQPGSGMNNYPLPPDMSGRTPVRPQPPQDPQDPTLAAAHLSAEDYSYYGEDDLWDSGTYDYDSYLEHCHVSVIGDSPEPPEPGPLVFLAPAVTSVKPTQENFNTAPDSAAWSRDKIGLSELTTTTIQPAVHMRGHQRVITHLCEMCGGGTVPALKAAINNNITVERYTYIDNDPAAFASAEVAVKRLQLQYPHLLPSTALLSWIHLPQAVSYTHLTLPTKA